MLEVPTAQSEAQPDPQIIDKTFPTGYLPTPAILGMELTEKNKSYLSHLYCRMAFAAADPIKLRNGERQEIGLITPEEADKGFLLYLEEEFGIKIVNFTYQDIFDYQSFKNKIEGLKAPGINSTEIVLYTNDTSPQIAKIIRNRQKMAGNLGFTITIRSLPNETLNNTDNKLPADLANDKLIFLKFCKDNGLVTFPKREGIGIEYSKNEKDQIDKHSEITNLDDIKANIRSVLQTSGKGVVIQFPKSGGGIGTYFIQDDDKILDDKYITVDAFIEELPKLTKSDSLKRSRVEGLVVAPESEFDEGPSCSFNVKKDPETGEAIVENLDITMQILGDKNACVGTIYPADISEEHEKTIREYSQKWADYLISIKYEGPTNLDFAIVNGVLVAVESNTRLTASYNQRMLNHISEEEVFSSNFDHYKVPAGTSTEEIINVLRGNKIPFIKTIGENPRHTGIALQTPPNSTGELSIIIVAPSREELKSTSLEIKLALLKLKKSEERTSVSQYN